MANRKGKAGPKKKAGLKVRRKTSRRSATTTNRAKAKFVEILAESCNVSAAARASGFDRDTFYVWRERDPQFSAAWDQAEKESADALEAEARRRAYDGILEPVFFHGEQVALVTRYSDRLMEVLLRGHKPEKFRERWSIDGKIDHSHSFASLAKLADDE